MMAESVVMTPSADAVPPYESGGRLRSRYALLKSTKGRIGLGLVGIFILFAVAAPLISPHNPLQQFSGQELVGPSVRFPLGTDNLGRDILSRVIYGARTSLLVAITAVAIGAAAGVTTGLIAGYVRGATDSVVMRFWDSVLSIPAVLLGIIVAAFFGTGTMKTAIALGIAISPTLARVARASAVQEKNKEYVAAARLSGVRTPAILLRHILPNSMGPLLIQLALSAGFAVLVEAALSYVGLGTQPPTPSWGAMIQGSQGYIPQAYWFWAPPGVAVGLLVVGLNFVADAMRDRYDPQTPVAVTRWL